jgi:hypothetical protein
VHRAHRLLPKVARIFANLADRLTDLAIPRNHQHQTNHTDNAM